LRDHLLPGDALLERLDLGLRQLHRDDALVVAAFAVVVVADGASAGRRGRLRRLRLAAAGEIDLAEKAPLLLRLVGGVVRFLLVLVLVLAVTFRGRAFGERFGAGDARGRDFARRFRVPGDVLLV